MALLPSDLRRAQEITDHWFRNTEFLRDALLSAVKDKDESTGEIQESDGNRRLAKLGYVALELAIVDEWFSRGLSHGELDQLRKKYLTRDHLCDVAQQKGLHTCPSMSKRQEKMVAPPQTMKLVLSAVIGAVWLDGGLNSVKSVLQRFGFFDWDFLKDDRGHNITAW